MEATISIGKLIKKCNAALALRRITLKKNNLLIVGCGDIGVPLARQLAESGHQVWGLRRNPALLPSPIVPLAADVTDSESLLPLKTLAFDYVVVTLTPASFSDEGYRTIFVEGLANVLTVLGNNPVKRLLFVSSTSVYHQDQHQWVDESSTTTPVSFSGRRLLEAEQLVKSCGIPSTVIRFAGIYGPGRRRLIKQVEAGDGCAETPPLYTNRIHRDDCVGFLAHLIMADQAGLLLESCYIGVDSEPVPMAEVKRWLAIELGKDPSQLRVTETPRRSSKRCSNRRMLSSGYRLSYDNFRQGYRSLLAN